MAIENLTRIEKRNFRYGNTPLKRRDSSSLSSKVFDNPASTIPESFKCLCSGNGEVISAVKHVYTFGRYLPTGGLGNSP